MRKIVKTTVLSLMTLMLVMIPATNMNAESYYQEAYKIRCTCYCDQGIMKSGKPVREGVIAGKEEWLGKAAVLYEVGDDGKLGDYIGIYEFLDTGYGINGSLQKGTSVDVYRPTLEECNEWVSEHGDYVYMQIIDGKG